MSITAVTRVKGTYGLLLKDGFVSPRRDGWQLRPPPPKSLAFGRGRRHIPYVGCIDLCFLFREASAASAGGSSDREVRQEGEGPRLWHEEGPLLLHGRRGALRCTLVGVRELAAPPGANAPVHCTAPSTVLARRRGPVGPPAAASRASGLIVQRQRLPPLARQVAN